MNNRIIWITIAWVIGYGLQIYYEWTKVGYVMAGAALLSCVLIHVLKLPHRDKLTIALVAIIAIGYYHGNDSRNQTAIPLEHENTEVVAKGDIASPVEIDGDKVSFTLDVSELSHTSAQIVANSLAQALTATVNTSVAASSTQSSAATPTPTALPAKERVQISLRLTQQAEQTTASAWRRGDRITIRSTLVRPTPAQNYGGFDYRRYLREHRIHWMLEAKGTASVTVVAAPKALSAVQVLRQTDTLRSYLAARIDLLFAPEHAPLMKGMLLGMNDALEPERFTQFSSLGLTHIIAISGLNVAVFLGALIAIFKRFRLSKETYLLVSICMMPPYILLTGASPSIVRAGIMAMIGLWATRQGHLKDVLHILCIVAIILLIWEPYMVLDVSFQLSFIATAGLIWAAPRVMKLLPSDRPKLYGALTVMGVSQLVSFPLSIYYFNQFSLLSPIANLLLVPIFSLVVYPVGLLALVFGLIWLPLGKLLGTLLGYLNSVLFQTMDLMAQWKGAMIWPSPTILWIMAYFGLLLVMYAFIAKWFAYRSGQVEPNEWIAARGKVTFYRSVTIYGSILTLIAWMFLLFVGYSPDSLSGKGEVQFISIGQGDSILIRTPTGKRALIDGGGTITFRKAGEEWKIRRDPYEVGRKLLVPLLKKRGVHELDWVFLSHADADHAGGLAAVLKDIPVKNFVFNGTYKPSADNASLFQTVLAKSISLRAVQSGQTLTLDEKTKLHILFPHANEDGNEVKIEAEQNESSIVFLLEMDGTKWLFVGDLGSKTELGLLQTWQQKHPNNPYGPIDVLKVGHHGSKHSTSREWLAWWQPKVAVISVGEKNSYGHPSEATLQRLAESESSVFRTDRMGEIQAIVQDGIISWRTKNAPK
ncbi:DNA internalization-related competence protein ComEC/Rec2 [Paenibacillus sp. N1-5-1-14]|uniref:DNA internalization-related competence protein ComEC/Rec2 n=1 Tax=Paenibacillus radicibacter TaxID=2972488 RepID=UPI002159A96E|nr:DNA internalization-related competence protein ComEC/Rec2 [Paenibacillus radicibacter]MCR8645724.1 DNA internalization-related competence protein ComEC/Rec2 [Paenibacillus radicibacter]